MLAFRHPPETSSWSPWEQLTPIQEPPIYPFDNWTITNLF